MLSNHIVIVGGGFSGTLSALVSARRAKQVTVIERFPDSSASKWAGTPQSHHGHSMSKKGQVLLEKLVPGILEELSANGATEVDWAENTDWHGPFGQCPRYTSGIRSLAFSRKLVERLLQDRARALPNVRYVQGSLQDIAIRNLMVQALHLNRGETITDIDLCIDARGRTSSLKAVLEGHIGAIPESLIENTVRYVTTVVDHRFESSKSLMQYYRQPNARNSPLGIYASPIENNRVIFTIVDYHGNVAKPFEHFKDHPLLVDKDIKDISIFSKLHNHHIQYGKAKQWLNNLVVIGDAVCRLNPVYGLGMTVSIEHVALLENALQGNSAFETHRLQKDIDLSLKEPWFLIKVEEMRSPHSKPNLFFRLVHVYLDQIAKAALHDIKLHKTSLEIIQRLKSPLAIFYPASIWRVLRSFLSARAVIHEH